MEKDDVDDGIKCVYFYTRDKLAGPSGRAVWGLGLCRLAAVIVGSNRA
jgi:hypothetical protein